MFRNSLTITLRRLSKDKTFSLINIFGLGIGIASCLLIFHYVSFELSYDRNVPDHPHIARLVTHDNARSNSFALTSPLVAPMLENELPEVERATRVFPQQGTVLINTPNENRAYKEERILYADANFFRIFRYPSHQGNSFTALEAPNSVVLTRSAAERFFGSDGQQVIGREVTLYNMFGRQTSWVSAVIDDLPVNSHIQAQIFFSFHLLESEKLKGWGLESWNAFPTYVSLGDNTSMESAQNTLDKVAGKYADGTNDISYSFQPLADVYMGSGEIGNALGPLGNSGQVSIFLIIACIILFIGWINYVNLTTARAAERIKEVGLKRIMGAGRVTLTFQFLLETCILHLLSLVVALTAFQLFLPLLSDLFDKDISGAFEIIHFPYLPLLLVIMVTGTLLSSLYPALVLSSFKPAAAIRGKFSSSGKGITLRKFLVVTQFAASFFLIGATYINYLQIEYMQESGLGLNAEQILVIEGPSIGEDLTEERRLSIKNELANLPFVSAFASSGCIPGKGYNYYTQAQKPAGDWKEAQSYAIVEIDASFLPAYEIPLLAGRNFATGRNEENNRIIINKAAMRRLGYTNEDQVIGKQVKVGNAESLQEIIGVIEDYHHSSLKESYTPIIFNHSNSGNGFSLRLAGSSSWPVSSMVEEVRSVFLSMAPDNPFVYFFLDEHYDSLYRSEIQDGILLTVFSLIAVLVACLGLYGLTSFSVKQRTKEIGVRKVLGASVSTVIKMLTRDFMTLIGIAILIALPVAYFALEKWLENFAFTIEYSLYLFIPPLLLLVFIALTTIGKQTYTAACENPVDSLRDE